MTDRELRIAGARTPGLARASGVLLAAAPVPWAVASWAHGAPLAASWWVGASSLLAVAALSLAGLVVVSMPRAGVVLASLGALGPLVLASPRLADAPALTLVMTLATAHGIGALWRRRSGDGAPPLRRRARAAGRARGAALGALAFWLVVGLAQGRPGPGVFAAVGAAMAIAMLLAAVWVAHALRRRPGRSAAVASGLVVAGALGLVASGDPWSMVGCGTIPAVLVLILVPRPTQVAVRPETWWGALLDHPGRMFVGTFALMCGLGAVVLALPQSASGEVGIGMVDAAFTAVSAVCVTGLAVRDTPVEFSGLGQAVILVLMQLGGLGIMTFSTAALRMLGRRVSLRHEAAVAHLIGNQDRSRLIESAQGVLKLTFAAEFAGAALLAPAFIASGDAVGPAIWRAVFTSVSAFCNAGFSLQSDSLVGFRSDPWVLHVVGVLIVVGGLSPVVIAALPRFVRRRGRPVSAQVGISIVAAAALLLGGFGFFLAAEWSNVLADLPVADRLHNAWLQSVTLRTAGFNSVDVASVRPATLVVMMTLMFIGGSPGGTAGGIKTTTATLILLAVIAAVRGRSEVEVFGRRIAPSTIQRALVVSSIAVLGLVIAVVAMLSTQAVPLVPAVFEVVSALGTVGLSLGATAELDGFGKLLIIACMFVGRVGGLTLLMLMGQPVRVTTARRPTEEIDVG